MKILFITIFVIAAVIYIVYEMRGIFTSIEYNNCNIENDFRKIYNGKRCSNFIDFGKFNDTVYGIEITSKMALKHWKINSEKVSFSKIDTKDNLITKITEYYINNADVWIIFQSENHYCLLYYNIASPSNAIILWSIKVEPDSIFNNIVLYVFLEKVYELNVIRYELANYDISDYIVVKILTKRVLKFFSESVTTKTLKSYNNSSNFLIEICVGCGFILSGFLINFVSKFESKMQQNEMGINLEVNEKCVEFGEFFKTENYVNENLNLIVSNKIEANNTNGNHSHQNENTNIEVVRENEILQNLNLNEYHRQLGMDQILSLYGKIQSQESKQTET